MIASRDIADLKPAVQERCKAFIDLCRLNGIDVIITSTYRDYESQNELYAQGRTKPGKIVTNARAGFSFHNFRVAFDFAPVVNGKVPWNDNALWRRCGRFAKDVGLEWAGDWTSFPEMAHCQFTGGRALAQLRDEASRA